MKNRNRSKMINAMKMISKGLEKSTIKAGIMAIIGIINAAMYMLLKHRSPSARLLKSSGLRSLQNLLDITFNPDIQMEPLNLKYTQLGQTVIGITTYISTNEKIR